MTDELARLAAEREAAWMRVCDAAQVYDEACKEYRDAVEADESGTAKAEWKKAETAQKAHNKARDEWRKACNAEWEVKMAANPNAPKLSELRGAFPDCTDGLPVAEYLRKIRAERAAE